MAGLCVLKSGVYIATAFAWSLQDTWPAEAVLLEQAIKVIAAACVCGGAGDSCVHV